MPALESRVPTDRPARYLRQFRTHAEAMASPRGHRVHAGNPQAAGEIHLRVEGTDSRTTAHFGPWGHCTLTAEPETLVVRIDATDAAALRRIRDILTRDLTRFGGGSLTVDWRDPD
ncbi:DUF2218 domain-containing protein [Nocardia sp. NPDC101769]|uniref:DUF2218 domain-containing protein n=1 Tax=Nocardia sp. NPDC101769 TaxID=3364333 RepID=UPI00380659E6